MRSMKIYSCPHYFSGWLEALCGYGDGTKDSWGDPENYATWDKTELPRNFCANRWFREPGFNRQKARIPNRCPIKVLWDLCYGLAEKKPKNAELLRLLILIGKESGKKAENFQLFPVTRTRWLYRWTPSYCWAICTGVRKPYASKWPRTQPINPQSSTW